MHNFKFNPNHNPKPRILLSVRERVTSSTHLFFSTGERILLLVCIDKHMHCY